MIGAICAPGLLEAPEWQTPTILGEEARINAFVNAANDPIGIQRFTANVEETLPEQLATTFLKALYIIRERTRELSAEYADNIVEQLGELLSIDFWDEDDQILKIGSLRTMLEVVAALGRGVGALTVAANGNLVSTWSAEDHVLRVEANPNGAVTWTSLYPRGAQPRHHHTPEDSIENLRAIAVDLLGDADGHPQRR